MHPAKGGETTDRTLGAVQPRRWTTGWLEVILPVYAAVVVLVYNRSDGFQLVAPDDRLESVGFWAAWIVGGALGGVLALSALFLAFYLLYSPLYLAMNLRRAMTPGVWTDPREFRFYTSSFVLLCVLIALAVWSPGACLVAFIILAGSAQLLWRLIL